MAALVKEEMSAAEAQLVGLVDQLDIAIILKTVSIRLFDRFSIWDLMLAKARLYQDHGSMECIMNDTEALLSELKLMIESCLTPVKLNRWNKKYEWGKRKRPREATDDSIEVDDMLGLALALESGMWKKKELEEVDYHSDILNIGYLFPERVSIQPTQEEMPNPVEVEADQDQDNAAAASDLSDQNLIGHVVDDNDENWSPPKKQPRVTAAAKKKKKVVKSQPEVKEEFSCEKCGKTYTNSTLYYTHMEKVCAVKVDAKVREAEGKFFCEFSLCPKKEHPFNTKSAVEYHWANAHVERKNKIIPCFLCDRRFATSEAKKEHMARDHTKNYKCTHCTEAYLTEGLLKKHLKTHKDLVKKENGPPAKTYLCLKCGQSMTHEYGKKHETKCTGQRVRRPEYKKVGEELFCTVHGCKLGYGFQSVYGLRKHFHDKHIREDEKFFACDYCDEKFSFLTTRNKHIKLKHLKSYVCDLCGRAFGSRDKVNKHRLTHTGEKPHACDKCEYRAANRSNLHAHRLSKHGLVEAKSFLCTLCNKQFTTLGRVHRHMSVAHGEDKEALAQKKRKAKMAPGGSGMGRPRKTATKKNAATSSSNNQSLQQQPQTSQVDILQQQAPPTQGQMGDVQGEQDAAVQYLQQQLEGPHGTVITVTPLYQQ